MKDILLDELTEKINEVNIIIEEINNFAEEKGKVKQICILKSSIIIILYNSIESILSLVLEAVHDQIQPVSFLRLSSKNKQNFINFYFSNKKKPKRDLFSDLINDDLKFPDFREYNNKINLFSGNLDARKIDEIFDLYGISKFSSSNREMLLYVKNKRNKLAHGEEQFSNACRDKTIGEIEKIRDEVKNSLSSVIVNASNYLSRGLYKSTT